MCGANFRPALGRGKAIISNPGFKCVACGADASHYFDVEDLSDPRAQRRKEAIAEREKFETIDAYN